MLDRRDPRAVQRRVVPVLAVAQIAGGISIGAAVSVGALLALDLSGSAAWSGVASTCTTLGAAAAAVPLTPLAGARRPAHPARGRPRSPGGPLHGLARRGRGRVARRAGGRGALVPARAARPGL